MASALLEKLVSIVGPQGLLQSPAEMEPYLEDWRGKEKGAAYCVALPKSTKQVSDIVKLANAFSVPVFPQGGNTGLCYGAVPSKSGECIVLSLKRMVSIRSVDRAANSIVVDAGIVLEAVHRAASEIGKSFPMHLGSEGSAQVGGLIATNAGGTNALRYGTMRDLTYGLEFVLPDGRVISDLDPLRKNNIGYDIKHLLIGGEGTLGVVTAASLKLCPALKSDAHAWLSFEKPSDAVRLLSNLQDQFDTSIIAYELLSQSQVDLVLRHIPRARMPFDKTPAWSVMIELGTPSLTTDLKGQLEDFLATQFQDCGLVDVVVAQNSTQTNDFWHVRHSVSEANKLAGEGLTHDIAVSVSQVPEFLEAAEQILAEYFPQSYQVITCHLGDGNIHYIAMFDHDIWDGLSDKHSVIEEVQIRVHDLAKMLGGTFCAEHGIGRKLKSELARLIDPAKFEILCKIKSAIDPNNILNPGVLIDQETVHSTAQIPNEAAMEA